MLPLLITLRRYAQRRYRAAFGHKCRSGCVGPERLDRQIIHVVVHVEQVAAWIRRNITVGAVQRVAVKQYHRAGLAGCGGDAAFELVIIVRIEQIVFAVVLIVNDRLDALQAAILRVKLTRLEEWTEQRIESAAHYDQLILAQGLGDWISRPQAHDSCRHVYNQYTIRVPAFERDDILGSLREAGIGCAVYYPKPLHLQPCFESLGYSIGSLPRAEAASAEVISLPIAPGLDAASRERVIERLAAACEGQANWSARKAA